MKKIIIAIDGHSSCGKSTMAKDLAKEIGYVYVDTGAMYRAVTLYALRNGYISHNDGVALIDESALQADINASKISISFKFNPETGRPDTYLNGEKVETEIRQMEVSSNVSPIAALPFVRTLLTQQQQEMGKEKGIVMDGRDIGTAVFPNAELKIFVTASSKVRAQRRYDELMGKAKTQEEKDALNYDEILKNVEERDYIDSHRETAPLKQAEDAVVLDNSNMTIAEQKEWLLKLTQDRVSALA
ncbi:MAG: (d)CMP kinase [Prevotellaceae bacterium]|nr:(d)CMP kinase [Candidatus Minthosoma caballi]